MNPRRCGTCKWGKEWEGLNGETLANCSHPADICGGDARTLDGGDRWQARTREQRKAACEAGKVNE